MSASQWLDYDSDELQARFDRQLAVGLGAATLALAVSCAFGDRFFNVLVTGNFLVLCALVADLVLESRAGPEAT